ncbi:MAG: serine hydrolase domain-containing protein [Cognatishimia sp.]
MPPDGTKHLLSTRVPTLMRRYQIDGISIAVLREGRVETLFSYGNSNNPMHPLVSTSTVFQAASLGKPVLAELVLQLAAEELIDLDRPLTSYLPDLFNQPDPRVSKISARLVLSHSSGLRNYGSDDNAHLAFAPGTGFEYSGRGFDALQQVIEHITGLSLETLAHRRLFDPLGMSQSSFVWQAEYDQHSAHGNFGMGVLPPVDPNIGDAKAAWSLRTTAGDYAKFMGHVMKRAIIPSRRALSPLVSQIEVTDQVGWGLGWGLQNTSPNHSIWHWGSNPGFRSFAVAYPVEGVGIVVMANSENLFQAVDDIILAAIGGSLPAYDWF